MADARIRSFGRRVVCSKGEFSIEERRSLLLFRIVLAGDSNDFLPLAWDTVVVDNLLYLVC